MRNAVVHRGARATAEEAAAAVEVAKELVKHIALVLDQTC